MCLFDDICGSEKQYGKEKYKKKEGDWCRRVEKPDKQYRVEKKEEKKSKDISDIVGKTYMNREEKKEAQGKRQNSKSRKLDKNQRYQSDSTNKTNGEGKIANYRSVFFEEGNARKEVKENTRNRE
jgi:hypothetical protein